MPSEKRSLQLVFFPLILAILLLFSPPGLSFQPDDTKSTQLQTERIERYIRVLVKGDDEARPKAAETLGEFEDTRAVHSLIEALKDTNVEVRKNAALSLGKIGDAQATEALINTMNNYTFTIVRVAAANALGKIGDPRAIVPLFIALGDRESALSQAAGNSLAKMGIPGGYFLYLGLNVSFKDAVEKLKSEATPRFYAHVLEAFEHWDIPTRKRVVWLLGNLRDEYTVQFLITILSDPYSGIRTAAVWSLGKIGGKRTVDPLLKALEDPSFAVREAAASSLGQSSDKSVVEPLIDILEDENPEVREAALWSLMKKGDKRALGHVIRAIEDSEAIVRIPAAWTLGKIGDVSAVEPLIIALDDYDQNVREAAIWSLSRISGQSAINHIIKAIEDESPVVRIAAVHALGYIGDTRGILPLIEAISDRKPAVQRAALSSLKKINHRLANILSAGLKGNRKALNRIVAEGDRRFAAIFLEALNSKSAKIRHTAVWYLGKIKESRAIYKLIILAKGWNLRDRFYGMVALSNIQISGFNENISLARAIYFSFPSIVYYLVLTFICGFFALAIPINSRLNSRQWHFAIAATIGFLVSGVLISLPAFALSQTYLILLNTGILPFWGTTIFLLLVRRLTVRSH